MGFVEADINYRIENDDSSRVQGFIQQDQEYCHTVSDQDKTISIDSSDHYLGTHLHNYNNQLIEEEAPLLSPKSIHRDSEGYLKHKGSSLTNQYQHSNSEKSGSNQ